MNPFFPFEYSDLEDSCDYIGEGRLDRMSTFLSDPPLFQIERLELLVQFDVKTNGPFDLRSGTEKLVGSLGRFQGSYLRGQGAN